MEHPPILVVQPNNLGDVITSLPLLQGIKNHFSERELVFFVEEGFEGGLVHASFCDRIIRFPRKALRDFACSAQWRDGLNNLRGIIGHLQAERFDPIINLSQHPFTSFLVSALSVSAARGQIFLPEGNRAIRDLWSQYLYAIPFARNCNNLHVSDIYRRIGGVQDCACRLPLLNIEKNAHGNAVAFLQSRKVNSEDRMLVLQPGAAYAAKRWPHEHFAALGTRLINDGWKVLITGAPAEKDIVDRLALSLQGRAITCAGELTFAETIALAGLAQGCITGDTAIMHAAAALGKKVYALFGPTNPIETGPYGDGHTVFAGQCGKRPCFCFDCKTRLCMKSIAPDDVYACVKGTVPDKPQCDIYHTVIDTTNECILVPVYEHGSSYISATGSAFARQLFELRQWPSELPPQDVQCAREESRIFTANSEQMALSLEKFIESHDTQWIRRYEELRVELDSLKGIGAFWTAILNIRLNSIPLLNPVAGITESALTCIALKQQVNAIVASLHV